MSCCLIVPTHNPGKLWPVWLSFVMQQNPSVPVIIVDTASTDGTTFTNLPAEWQVLSISKEDFNHGGTRNLALELLSSEVEIVVFVTQDALLVDPRSIHVLISAFNDPNVGVNFKKQSGLNILGVGYTVYLGGEKETVMLKEASRIVREAHQNGLIAVIWMYPRGKNIKEEDIHTIAGGAGVAAALGADFVKVKYPYDKKIKATAESFQEVIHAAGRTNVICVGGSKQDAKELITYAYNQKHVSGSKGIAIGRNLHQRSLKDAILLATALALVINHDTSLEDALAVYAGKKKIEKHRRSDFLGLF